MDSPLSEDERERERYYEENPATYLEDPGQESQPYTDSSRQWKRNHGGTLVGMQNRDTVYTPFRPSGEHKSSSGDEGSSKHRETALAATGDGGRSRVPSDSPPRESLKESIKRRQEEREKRRGGSVMKYS